MTDELKPVQVSTKGKEILALRLGHDEAGNLAMDPAASWAGVGTVRPVQSWRWQTEDGELGGVETSRAKAIDALLAAQQMQAESAEATIPSLIEGL